MSAIIWIALIIIFAVVEIITVGLTSIWFAGGAVVALILNLLGCNEIVQVVAFLVVSIVLLCFTRPWAMKYFKPRLVRTNYEEAIGQNVCLTETVDNQKGTGTAVLKGQEWTARAAVDGEIFQSGEIVTVKEIHGVTLYVVAGGNAAAKETE